MLVFCPQFMSLPRLGSLILSRLLTSWAVEQNILQLKRKLKLLEDIELNISRVPSEMSQHLHSVHGLITYRGKLARRQNYYRQHNTTSSTSDHFPILPASVMSLATLPLPATTLFHEAVQNELDETELPQWDLLQTYLSPGHSQNSDIYNANIVDVLHGRRLRIQKDEATARFKIFRNNGRDGLHSSIVEEAQLVLTEWEAVGSALRNLEGGTCHHTMAHHLLQWKSRKLCVLRKDWEALELGGDAYTAQYFKSLM
jgi:hypothetical protein